MIAVILPLQILFQVPLFHLHNIKIYLSKYLSDRTRFIRCHLCLVHEFFSAELYFGTSVTVLA